MKAMKQLCAILVAAMLLAGCAMPGMADAETGAVYVTSEPTAIGQDAAGQQAGMPGDQEEQTPDVPDETQAPDSVDGQPSAPQDPESGDEGGDELLDNELPEETPTQQQPDGVTEDGQPTEDPLDESPKAAPEDELPEDELPEDGQPEDETPEPEPTEQPDPYDGLAIRITHDATDEMYYGDTITLTGHLDGFEDVESYVLTWYHDDGDDNWTVAQQGGLTHAFELTEQSVSWNWRLTAKIQDE